MMWALVSRPAYALIGEFDESRRTESLVLGLNVLGET
jgi:hypothetical protein